MNMSTTMFGLRHNETGKLLGFNTCAGGEEYCVDVEFELDVHSDNVWLVPRIQQLTGQDYV